MWAVHRGIVRNEKSMRKRRASSIRKMGERECSCRAEHLMEEIYEIKNTELHFSRESNFRSQDLPADHFLIIHG